MRWDQPDKSEGRQREARVAEFGFTDFVPELWHFIVVNPDRRGRVKLRYLVDFLNLPPPR